MSRVGKLPIPVPTGVKVEISGLNVKVQGPKGFLEKVFAGQISIEHVEGSIVVKPLSEEARAMWGTARSIINGMVKGVTSGFTEELEVNGVGYRASVKGKYLNLTLGKSHNTKIEIPEGIKVGDMLQAEGPMGPVNVKVAEIKEGTIVVDANHPLAGQKLIFDLELVSID